MDFYIGQIFEVDYPEEAAEWCNENGKVIEDNGMVDGVRQFIIAEPEVPPVTMDDYDRVMEAHITAACVDRGYTLREPDVYKDSSVPRWRQDAQDFIAFRDACLLYGQSIINTYN